MTIAGDLQNALAAQIERDPKDMDALVRVVFDFLLDGNTVGFLAGQLNCFDGTYIDEINELKAKILSRPHR